MHIEVSVEIRRSVLLLLGVATLLSAGCFSADGASANTTSAAAGEGPGSSRSVELPVATEDARDGDLILRVTTTGQVRSDALVPLRAEVPGTVAEVRVRPGQAVAAGAVLVTFDAYPFDLAVREAQARADEAEQRFLESFVPESVVTGRGPTPEQRRALMNKAGVTGARLQLERARYELARASVRSPLAGMVQAVDVAVGEKLGAGQAIATVVDTRNLRVEAQLLEHDLPLVRPGGEALVTTAGAPGRRIQPVVATPSTKRCFMGRPAGWMKQLTGREALRSPGAPSHRREVERQFWAQIATGITSEKAAEAVGVSPAVGTHWFRDRGGMPLFMAKPVCGRYLSFAEREEIGLLRAQEVGVREIARRIDRSPSTVSRELKRNAATRGGKLEYRASVAHWKSELVAKRPKPAKLETNPRLRDYVQQHLEGTIYDEQGRVIAGPRQTPFVGRNKPHRGDCAFHPSRSRISVQSDHRFRSVAISRFG
jgi:biotin carboxyl carrier protein